MTSAPWKGWCLRAAWASVVTLTAFINQGCDSSSSRFAPPPPPPPAPVLAPLSPSTGLFTGGTSVTIGLANQAASGFRFRDPVTVSFGSVAGTVNTVTDTQLTVTTPTAAVPGSVIVTVTTPDATLTLDPGFTFEGMTITSVAPGNGLETGGDLVTIEGTNFFDVGAVSIFNSFTVVSDTTITGTTTAVTTGTGTVDVSVISSSLGTVTLPNGFTYDPPPPPPSFVTSILPNSGIAAGGYLVTISGAFPFPVSSVTINGVSLLQLQATATQLTGTMPPIPVGGPFDVVVNQMGNPTTLTLPAAFTSTGVTLTNVSPNFGDVAGGTPVIISGTGFQVGMTTVTIGGVNAPVTTDSATQITVTAPASTSGAVAVDVVVTTPTNGTATLPGGFTYFMPGSPPVVSAINPNNGPESGGTEVTISGTGFLSADIAFIGSALLNFQVVDSTTITGVTAPLDGSLAAPLTTAVVVRSTQLGDSNTNITFNYTPAVRLDRVSPNQGPISGNQTVQIFGRNFQGVTAVQFGTVSAGSFTVLPGNTELVVTTPPGLGQGPVAVTLVGDATFASAVRTFAYTYGPIFSDPTLEGVDTFDPSGDVFGPQFPPSFDFSAFGNIGAGSRIEAGDYFDTSSELVAVTLPGSNEVEIFITGVTINAASNDCPPTTTLQNTTVRLLQTVMLGAAPIDLVWTDLNTDAAAELCVLDANGAVTVIQVAGGAMAVPMSPFAGGSGGNPTSISTVDVDDDGDMDIVTSGGMGPASEVNVLLSDGMNPPTLTLNSSLNLNMLPGAQPNPDPIRVLGAQSQATEKFGVDADTAFQVEIRYPKHLTADLNRDGIGDIAVLNGNGTVTYLLCGGQDLTTSASLTAPSPAALPPAATEMLVVSVDNGPLQTVNITAAETTPAQLVTALNAVLGMGVASEMGGVISLTSPSTGLSSAIRIDETSTAGALVASGFGPSRAGLFPRTFLADRPLNAPLDLFLTDFDFDLRLDPLVLTGDNVAVLRGSVDIIDQTASIAQVSTVLFPLGGPAPGGLTNPLAMTSADFNYDCRDDIAIANANGESVAVFLSQGGGTYEDAILYQGQAAFNLTNTTVRDLTFSRRFNMWVVADHTDMTRRSLVELELELSNVFTGNANDLLSGALSASDTTALATGADPRDVALADMDGNGTNDVVVCNIGAASIEVRLNAGEGVFQDTISTITSAAPRTLAIADIDDDGDPDVVVANALGLSAPFDQVTVHLNGGAGILAPGNSYVIFAKEPRDLALADVNGDDILDVLTCNQQSNNFSVLLGNGDGTFDDTPGNVGLFGLGNAPTGFVVRDMGVPENGTMPSLTFNDPMGLPDVVACNSADDSVTIVYNNFGGVPGQFGLGETYPLDGLIPPNRLIYQVGRQGRGGIDSLQRRDVEPVDVLVIDINGDTGPDIVTVDQGTNTITILHANIADRQHAPVDPADYDRYEGGLPITGLSAAFHSNNSANGPTANAAEDTMTPTNIPMPLLTGVSSSSNVRKFFLPTDYRHNGDPNDVGQPRIIIPAGTAPCYIASNDLNYDARPDLVVGSFGSSDLTIFINNGNSFQEQTGPFLPAAPTRGDDDADPQADPLRPYFTEVIFGGQHVPADMGDPTGPLAALAGGGEAIFCGYQAGSRSPVPFVVPVGGPVTGLALGRINNDCPPDVAVIRADNRLVVFFEDTSN